MDASRFSRLVAAVLNSYVDPRIRMIEEHGWIPLGERSGTGVRHWTTLERGLQEGGPVSLDAAYRIQFGIGQRQPPVQ